MRDLMSLTARPEVISLAGGLPATDKFPREVFERINACIASNGCAAALQYAPTEGFDTVKQDIVTVMSEEGSRADPDHIMVTTGGQQAIDLVTKTFIDPGDVILAESPAYPGALTTFMTYQARVVHVPTDDCGIVPDRLERVLSELKTEGRRPKLLYVVPNFSNPSGVTVSLERRKVIVDIAARERLLIVEDNPYGLLRFEGELLPTLFSLDTVENVVYLGSFSKIVSPGIRTGWLAAPSAIYQKIVLGKQAVDLCSSSLTQMFVHEFVHSGDWKEYVADLRATYAARRDAMLEALAEELPQGSTWTRPEGGFFVWVTLPHGIHTGDLLVKAIERNVAFVRGDAFFVDGQGTASMRLNFSYNDEERIREGVRRLGEVIREHLELRRSLGFS
jgi:2-aminoadipate transaminase